VTATITPRRASLRRPQERSGQLTGTPRLVRLALRRDRVVLPVWIAVLIGLLAATVGSISSLYATEADRLAYATVAATNVVARAFDGPMAGTSLGAITMTESFGILALLAGIMSVQAIVRHTRLEEETGRAELVGAGVIGRHAPLVAALLVVAGANLVTGITVSATLVLAGLPATGSVLAGAALAGVGLTFAGVAAVAAQVSGTARGANTIGIVVVAATFLLRAIGDATGRVTDSGVDVVSAWPSWLSPIGWGQQIRAFGDDRAALLWLFVITAGLLIAAAFNLRSHRDVGAGVLPTRPGPAVARPTLRHPLGFALRLHRGALIGWVAGLALVASALGAVAHEVEELLETSEELAALVAATGDSGMLVDLYIAFAIAILALAATAYLIQAVLRVRSEELAGRVEPVLATAVGRTRYLAAHLLWAIVGLVAILLVIAVSAAVTAGVVTGDWDGVFADWLLAAAVQVPAALVIGGIAVVAVAWLPRLAAAVAWTALTLSLVIGQFGQLFGLPQAVTNLSPFTHVPAVPAEDLQLLPMVILVAIAAGLHLVGFVGWRRRDLRC
jgi:ABC-2 type transport system permease protein